MVPAVSELDRAAFRKQGYLVVPGMVPPERCERLRAVAEEHLASLIAPVEFEIDVHYPGAPVDPDSPGARTSRRLLQAFARHETFRDWGTDPAVRDRLPVVSIRAHACPSRSPGPDACSARSVASSARH